MKILRILVAYFMISFMSVQAAEQAPRPDRSALFAGIEAKTALKEVSATDRKESTFNKEAIKAQIDKEKEFAEKEAADKEEGAAHLESLSSAALDLADQESCRSVGSGVRTEDSKAREFDLFSSDSKRTTPTHPLVVLHEPAASSSSDREESSAPSGTWTKSETPNANGTTHWMWNAVFGDQENKAESKEDEAVSVRLVAVSTKRKSKREVAFEAKDTEHSDDESIDTTVVEDEFIEDDSKFEVADYDDKRVLSILEQNRINENSSTKALKKLSTDSNEDVNVKEALRRKVEADKQHTEAWLQKQGEKSSTTAKSATLKQRVQAIVRKMEASDFVPEESSTEKSPEQIKAERHLRRRAIHEESLATILFNNGVFFTAADLQAAMTPQDGDNTEEVVKKNKLRADTTYQRALKTKQEEESLSRIEADFNESQVQAIITLHETREALCSYMDQNSEAASDPNYQEALTQVILNESTDEGLRFAARATFELGYKYKDAHIEANRRRRAERQNSVYDQTKTTRPEKRICDIIGKLEAMEEEAANAYIKEQLRLKNDDCLTEALRLCRLTEEDALKEFDGMEVGPAAGHLEQICKKVPRHSPIIDIYRAAHAKKYGDAVTKKQPLASDDGHKEEGTSSSSSDDRDQTFSHKNTEEGKGFIAFMINNPQRWGLYLAVPFAFAYKYVCDKFFTSAAEKNLQLQLYKNKIIAMIQIDTTIAGVILVSDVQNAVSIPAINALLASKNLEIVDSKLIIKK